MRVFGAVVVVLLLFVVVPFPVYTALAAVTGMEPPKGDASVALFFARVLLEKTGHAVAFVGIFAVAPRGVAEHWKLYAALWWVMFALGEAAMALGPDYTLLMAIGGVISEAIYLPAAALACRRLLPSA